MDLEGLMLNEMSDRERQILYDLTYMWTPKNKTNKQNKMKTDSQIQRTNEWLPEGRGREIGERGLRGTNLQLRKK